MFRKIKENKIYKSTKTYGHDEGLSCAFRQPEATHSHCSLIHGYSLSFKFTFGCKELDNKNWVVDFGGLKELKAWLKDTFDHTLAVDVSDVQLKKFQQLEKDGLCKLKILDGVGCEKFAEHAFNFADKMITNNTDHRCWVEEVEVREHGGNSAIVQKNK